MSNRWEDEVSDHPLHDALVEFNEYLDGQTAAGNKTQTDLATIRARAIAGRVKDCLEGADPLFLSPQRLTQIQKHLTAFKNEIEAFQSDKDDSHVLNAHNNLDSLLDLSSRIPIISVPEDAKRLSASAVAFREQTKKLIKDLQQQADQTSEKVSEVSNLQEAVRQSLESTKTGIEAQKTRLDSAISDFQRQFSEVQSSQQQSFSESEKQRASSSQEQARTWEAKLLELANKKKEDFDELINSSRNDQDAVKAETEERVSNLLKDIESRRDKAKEIVGIIAGTGMAGGYQRDADQQRVAFNIWNGLTILGFLGLIGFAVSLFFETTQTTEITWAQVGARLLAIVAFGAFAAYGGRMAMKHRESERQHRHKQLALESINAFLEDLEPDVQRQVKTKMAEVFFAQSENSSKSADDVAPTTIDGLLKLLNKMVDKNGR